MFICLGSMACNKIGEMLKLLLKGKMLKLNQLKDAPQATKHLFTKIKNK